MKPVGEFVKLSAETYVRHLPDAAKDDAVRTFNTLMATSETFNTAMAAITTDRNLTPQGRAAAAAQAAAKALTVLTGVETKTVAKLAERAASLEKSLLSKAAYTPPKDPAERVTHEARLKELRDQIRQLSTLERRHLYTTSTDPVVLAAFETATPTLSQRRPDGSRTLEAFIAPEDIAKAQMARARAADPTTAGKLDEAQMQQTMYSTSVNATRRELLESSNVAPGAEPVPVPTVV